MKLPRPTFFEPKSSDDYSISRRKLAQVAARQGREADYVQHFVHLLDDLDDKDIEEWVDNLVGEVWQARSGKLEGLNKRFFGDLYTLLMHYGDNPGRTKCLLAAFSNAINTHFPRGSHAEFAKLYCEGLLKIADASLPEVRRIVPEVHDTASRLGDMVLGEGWQPAYDFYRRVDLFFSEIAQGKNLFTALPSRMYDIPYSPTGLELANALLDALRVDKEVPMAYLFRYLENLREARMFHLADFPFPERRVCEAVLERFSEIAFDTPARLRFGLEAENPRSYNRLVLTITNTGFQRSRFTILKVQPDCISGDKILPELAPLESISRTFTIYIAPSQPSFEVCIKGREGEDGKWRIAWLRQSKEHKIEKPYFDMRWDPTSRYTITRQKLLNQLWDPLNREQPVSSVRFVCGIPRVGKTSLLQEFKKQLLGDDRFFVSYIDLQLILPLWPKDKAMPALFDGSELKRFLRDMVSDIHMPYVDPQLRAAFAENFSGSIDEMLGRFVEFLAQAAGSRKLVLIMDEFSTALAMLERDDPVMLEKLLEALGPRLKTINQVPVHYIICGAEDLPNRPGLSAYPLLSSIDPRPIFVGGLSEEETKELLEKPFRNNEEDPQLWFDDLALKMLHDYTGGHPLLVRLISQKICELLIFGKISTPIGSPEVYQLLSSESDLGVAIDRVTEMIWKNLTEETRQRLREVLDLRAIERVNFLLNLGLLRIAENGKPQVQIGALARQMGK